MSIVGSSRESSHRGFGVGERETSAKGAPRLVWAVALSGVVLSTVLSRGIWGQMGGLHSAYTLAAQFAPHTTPRRGASLEADEGLGRGQRLQVTAAVFSLDVAVATTTHLIAFADFTAAMGFCPGAAHSAHISSLVIGWSCGPSSRLLLQVSIAAWISRQLGSVTSSEAAARRSTPSSPLSPPTAPL